MPATSLFFRLGAAGVLFATAGYGQLLPVSRLTWIFPPGASPGSTTEVRIAGSDLEDAAELRFNHPGLTALRKEANVFQVVAASNVPPAFYEARAFGRLGISNPRIFVIDDRPQVLESGTHDTRESASSVTLETVVNGRTEANAIDYYKFSAKKGQRILISCLAESIDSRLQPSLILTDSAGRELERNRRGGLIDFTATTDGEYNLAVFDTLYGGGEGYFYRLQLSGRPQLDFVLPLAALPGTTNQFTLYGRNLPRGTNSPEFTMEGKPLDQQEVQIALPADSTATAFRSLALNPAAAVIEAREYRLPGPTGLSNPLLISYATAPVVLEQALNDRSELAQQLTLPCEVSGQFYPAGDQDWFAFEAKKGAVYWVEVYSQRLGHPTDPFVVLQRVTKNDKGQEQLSDLKEIYDNDANLGGTEFNTASRDPAWRFEVKDDGQYRLLVRDLFNQGRNRPELTYRLSLRHERPDFTLVAMAKAPAEKDKRQALQWTAFVRRGETIPVQVMAFRRDNFAGDIQLSIDNLPKGLRCLGGELRAGVSSTELLLTADDTAEAWAGSLRILGRALIQGSNVVRVAKSGTVTWTVQDANTEAVDARLAANFAAGLSGDEEAPITINVLSNAPVETSVAGKVAIALRVERRGEFPEKLKLKASGPPGFDKVKEIELEAKETNAIYEINLSQTKLEAGTYTLYFQTQTKGKFRNNYAAAQAAEVDAKAAEKKSKELSEAAQKAEQNKQKAAQAVLAADKKTKEVEMVLANARQAVVAAEKDLAASQAAAKEALAKRKSAEEAVAQAGLASKEAEARKTATNHRAKELKDKSKPKDAAVNVYSPPLQLKVTPAPIRWAGAPSSTEVVAGHPATVRVQVQRLYGFNEPIEVTLKASKEKGIKGEKATIAKDASETNLKIEVGADATPGERKLVLQADLKLNGQEIKVEQPVTLKILPAAKAAAAAAPSQAKAP